MSSSQYHHGNLKQALVRASLDLIREKGAAAFTLREVARRAGVAHTAAYRHFRDKQHLLAAIAQHGFERLGSALEKARLASDAPQAQLRGAGAAYVRFAMRHPEEFQVMFGQNFDANYHPETEAASRAAFQILLDLVVLCGFDGINAARVAWAQVHGLAELILKKQFSVGSRTQIRDLIQLSLDAILQGLQRTQISRKR